MSVGIKLAAVVIGLVTCVCASGALLDRVYELRKHGSPYGLFDLQSADTPARALAVLESWAAPPAVAPFATARSYVLWDLLMVVGAGVALTALLGLIRGPLRNARMTPSGWHGSDRLAVVLDVFARVALVTAVLATLAGVAANLLYWSVLSVAEAAGPEAAVGARTVAASLLARGKVLLMIFSVIALTVSGLYLLARNRDPRVKEFLDVAREARFSLLAVAVVGAALCIPDQLRDAFRALVEGSWIRVAVTEVVLLAWAFTVWYTGRFLLNVSFQTTAPILGHPAGAPAAPPPPRFGERSWPRLLGAAAFLVFALATLLAWWEVADAADAAYPRLLWLSIVNAPIAPLFWAVTRQRQRIAASLTGRPFASPRGRLYRDMPGSVRWLVRGAVFVTGALWLIVFAFPQTLAPYLGTVTLLLGASITVTIVGSFLVWIGERAKLPSISIVFGLAILFSLTNDNHTVRRLPDAPRPPRIDVVEHLDHWYRWLDAKYPNVEQHPLFIVSAAGGGIRAAYWTAVVLARLQDVSPAFVDHTFLVSSVSGGSLGSLVFANLLDTTEGGGDWRGSHASFGKQPDPECDYPAHAPGKYQILAASLLVRDFLAPTAASMLYGDFLARLLPFSALSDRAQALEVSWERAWDRVRHAPPAGVGPLWKGNPFSRSFDDLYTTETVETVEPTASPKRHVPLVVLNGTIVESGTRVLVSHLKHPPKFRGDLENAFDHRNAPMRMSTAALMSARFTYVSPAGTLAPGTHVVDGGYFENSGAATALQWWAEVEDALGDLHARHPGRPPVRSVFIYIDNSAPEAERARGAAGAPEPARMESPSHKPRLLPEISAPIAALLAARGAHAVQAKARAQRWFGNKDFVAFDTNLTSKKKGQRLERAPLGWVLSRTAQRILDRELCRNDDAVGRVAVLLPKAAPGAAR